MDRKRKLNWLIYCLPYDKKIGGSVVMHHLAKSLADMGDKVLTTNDGPFNNVRTAPKDLISKIDKKDWIIVFSESNTNKVNFPNVVRWVLYILGGFKGYNGFYHPNELVVQYGKGFTTGTQYENVPELTNLIFEFDFWKDLNLERSEQDLILIKKGRHFSNQQNRNGRILDEENYTDETLLQAFNEHKRFVTYDNNTFHSVQAAVCGAISIVIPDGRQSEEEWRSTSRNRTWGIAYGDTPEQIKYALETRNLLINNLKNQVDEGNRQIIELRNNVLEKFPDQYHITCVIETEWKNLYLVDQLENYKKDNFISQIIIIDRDKKNRPSWLNLDDIEIYESDLEKIPSIELGIDKSINDIVLIASDKIKFETNEFTEKIINNKGGLGVFFIEKSNFIHKNTQIGFLKDYPFDYEDSKIIDNLIVLRKTQYIKTPGLKKYGLPMWLNKIYTIKHSITIKNYIEGVELINYENIIETNDKDLINKIL